MLAACTGSFFKSKAPPPIDVLLSVTPTDGGRRGVAIPVDLTVLMPRVRTGLDTDRIAALYPDGAARLFRRAPAGAVRWTRWCRISRCRLFAAGFATCTPTPPRSTPATGWRSTSWTSRPSTTLEGAAARPTVHVHLLARVGNAGDRRVLGEFEADVREPAADNRLTAVVAAYDAAAQRALGEIVDRSTQTLDAPA